MRNIFAYYAILFSILALTISSRARAEGPLKSRQAPASLITPSLPTANAIEPSPLASRRITTITESPEAAAVEEMKTVESRADHVVIIMGVWIGVVTLLFLFLGAFFGISEYKSRTARQTLIDAVVETTRKAAEDATRNLETVKRALTEVEKARTDVDASITRIREFDSAVQTSSQSMTAYFDKLLESERPGGLNLPVELPDEETLERMEEADVLLMVAERVAPGSFTSAEANPLSAQESNRRKATYFVKLGKYWDVVENYARAIARFRKAIELNPKSWQAHIGLARTHSFLAARPNTTESQRTRLLANAETHANQALHILRAEEHYQNAQLPDQSEDHSEIDLPGVNTGVKVHQRIAVKIHQPEEEGSGVWSLAGGARGGLPPRRVIEDLIS